MAGMEEDPVNSTLGLVISRTGSVQVTNLISRVIILLMYSARVVLMCMEPVYATKEK